MTNKDETEKDGNESNASKERYTIFHALFETLKEKDKKGKNR